MIGKTAHFMFKLALLTLDGICFIASLAFSLVLAQIEVINKVMDGMPMWVRIICALSAAFYLVARSVKMMRKD